jgi:predicted dehydrogenase
VLKQFRHIFYCFLQFPISNKERIIRPELAGGALLDIGVYTLNFAAMAFGSDIAETHSVCQKTQTGVDAQEIDSRILQNINK